MNKHPDYLVVGAGASAMAFVDVMLNETDATFAIVDKRDAPGGHWNDAYPFVRLHQPASYYGVASRALGRGHKDKTGNNAGFYELSSGVEITNYYHTLLRDVFLESGRVSYYPMTEHLGDGEIVSLLSGERRKINYNKKFVDATLLTTNIPLTHKRKFEIADGVTCVPPNDLPRFAPQYRHFMVIGAGKTAMDAITWLRGHGAPAHAISWVRPRDSWFFNRAITQSGSECFNTTMSSVADMYEASSQAETLDDFCQRLEQVGRWLRIDKDVWPTMFHAAILTDADIRQLQEIKKVIRKGHVKRIETDKVVLTDGEESHTSDTLFVDCTASALPHNVNFRSPIFEDNKISLQMIRQFQPCFSAALIGHLEATIDEDAEKNALAGPTPMVDSTNDYLLVLADTIANQLSWAMREDLATWIAESRLDAFGKFVASVNPGDTEKMAIIERIKNNAVPAIENLRRLAATV